MVLNVKKLYQLDFKIDITVCISQHFSVMMTELETTDITKTRTRIGHPCEDEAARREFVAAVQEGLAELDRGEFITHEDLECEYYSWTFK